MAWRTRCCWRFQSSRRLRKEFAPGFFGFGNTIAFYPRLSLGEVVLQRAIWKIAPGYLPKRAPTQSDADYFLAITRWQKENGLPRRVFVTPDSYTPRDTKQDESEESKDETKEEAKVETKEEAKEEAKVETKVEPKIEPEKRGGKSENAREAEADQLIRKPMYLDFENFFSVMLLERVVARRHPAQRA